jgi:hypothetical protein
MKTLEDFVISQHGTIKVLDGWALLYQNELGIYADGVDQYSDEGMAAFKLWCAEHNVAFYGAPKEDFFKFEAYELAENKGASYLLMENLS